MDGSVRIDPYLSGNFAPVRSEDDFDLEVTGQIPAGIRGAFYRNGPNPRFEPRGDYHWFSGDGMIHGFFVEDGKVSYRNRYVRTPKWEIENSAGKALFGGFDPRAADPSVAGKDGGVSNTNIVWHAGRLMALEEAHEPFELDPITLESRGYVDAYRGKVTAHPKASARCPFPTPSPMASPPPTGRWCGATTSRRRSPAWCTTSWSPTAMRSFPSCR
jgi:carotenoid cleavage dioxygenase